MNTEFFIAKRLIRDRESSGQISRSIVKIAVFGIALGLAVMIVTVATVTAFKDEIRKKVIGFGSHLQIVNYDANPSYETVPISKNQDFIPALRKLPGIKHVQAFTTKPAIIKTENEIQGVVLKGVDADYDWSFFQENLAEGKVLNVKDPATSNGILLSKKITGLLHLKIGDPVIIYFVQDPPRMRKLIISGIYETGLEEFDKSFALVDMRLIQRLNNWGKDSISGFEVFIDDFDRLNAMSYEVSVRSNKIQSDGSMLRVVAINEKYPHIFDWLGLFNMNVTIIIVLMVLVAGINMVSGLLVLILERTNMIGILKALGTENVSIRKIFLYMSIFLVLRGLLWGNLIGIGICFIQHRFSILKLDPSAYFLSTVPMNFEFLYFLFLNIGTLLVVLIILLIPSLVISGISPEKTIRFD